MAVTSIKNSIRFPARFPNMRGTEGLPPYGLGYIVVSGGGGGGNDMGGGGGAGGYRASIAGELSGGGASAETPVTVYPGDSFTVTIGAGGHPGTASTFGNISPTRGGDGGNRFGTGQNGGSGGGGGANGGGAGSGTAGEGFNGRASVGGLTAGGGGGAGAAANSNNGGAGLTNNITGSGATKATGGRGGFADSGNQGGRGANTGEGGWGGGSGGAAGGNGGSGIVYLRLPDSSSLTVGAGLTFSTTTTGGYNVYTFTSGTDTVTVV